MSTVAAHHEVTLQRLPLPMPEEGDSGAVSGNVVELKSLRFVDEGDDVRVDGLIEVPLQFGLPVDGDVLADEPHEVDADQTPIEGKVYTFVSEAFLIHPVAEASTSQNPAAAVLDNPGSDPFEHVLAGSQLEDHTLDTFQMEEVCEQRAGWASSDNGYLRAFWDLAHAAPATLGPVLYASRTNGRSAYRK